MELLYAARPDATRRVFQTKNDRMVQRSLGAEADSKVSVSLWHVDGKIIHILVSPFGVCGLFCFCYASPYIHVMHVLNMNSFSV